jgi:hypothetical protein
VFASCRAARADGSVRVVHRDGAPLGTVILFERRGARTGFEIRRSAADRVSFPQPQLTKDVAALTSALEQILAGSGLYPREAKAMVDTWRDSWFEEGTRVFYVLPDAAVDAMLPLTIEPRPSRVARVFVGRMEVITPATRAAVERALGAGDVGSLRPYGRFLAAISEQIFADPAVRLDRAAATRLIYGPLAAGTPAPGCQ